MKEDIKELGVGHFDQELESLRGDFESEKWVRQGYLSKGNVLSTTQIHGCLGGDKQALQIHGRMVEWTRYQGTVHKCHLSQQEMYLKGASLLIRRCIDDVLQRP